MFNNKSKKNSILILGLGGVGFYLAKRLVHEGYDVTAIEPDARLIKLVDSKIDARLIQGDAMNLSCWKEADANEKDLLIAVTNNDAVNIISSTIADRYGIKRKIARIRSLDLMEGDSIINADDFKVDLIINPEEIASQEVVRFIKRTAGNEILDIAQGQMQVMATRIQDKSPLANKKLKEISQIYKNLFFLVAGIVRGSTTIIPGGEDVILPQDQVLFMARQDTLTYLMELIGVKQYSRHRVMILGGGLVGSRVADLLGKTVKIKLIEKDGFHAKNLSMTLKNADILHGDGSDAEILESAGIANMDTFVTATSDDETNIMTCLLAKNLMISKNPKNRAKTLAMINKEEYLVLSSTMGLDIALNKKILAGNEILKFIRRGELLSVVHLHGFDMEVVELQAAENSQITKVPLVKLDPYYYGKILIGAVFRDERWITPTGDTHIQEGERVIVICQSMMLKDVQKLFF